MSTTPIDLSLVPPPAAVEALDLDELVAAWRARFESDFPEGAGLVSEADPAAKWRRTGAYRELLLRRRVNDGAEACMLARATGTDLENLVAIFNLRRETLVEARPGRGPAGRGGARVRRAPATEGAAVPGLDLHGRPEVGLPLSCPQCQPPRQGRRRGEPGPGASSR